MNCFVTGGSGFIGANLVRELNARGHRVKALLRSNADLLGLKGADFERVEGDLRDRAALARWMRGCDWCFHLAASYHLWLRDYASMFATNVQGTRDVIEAAVEAGVSRIVYTSTAGCVGMPKQTNGSVTPSHEETPVSDGEMNCHYKLSKWRAESIAREMATHGAPVIIVNPSAPVGPGDLKPTPTGRIVLDFLNGAMPAYLDTGLNWVHVRDVAIGHILAAEKGRVGERYIFGNENGNWTMKEMLESLADLTGLPAPRVKMPYWAALSAARVSEFLANLTGRPPRVPLSGVRMAKSKMFFNPAKAIRELGLPQTPPKQALADAVEWFRRNGYVRK